MSMEGKVVLPEDYNKKVYLSVTGERCQVCDLIIHFTASFGILSIYFFYNYIYVAVIEKILTKQVFGMDG